MYCRLVKNIRVTSIHRYVILSIFDLQNCSSSGVSLKRVSRLSLRSNSTSETCSQHEKPKHNFHSTRHPSLQRFDSDLRQKTSSLRSAIASKQNSPVRNSSMRESRRISSRKSPTHVVNSNYNQTIKNNSNSRSNASVDLANNDNTFDQMSDVNNVSKKCSSNDSEAFKAATVDHAYVDDEDSSSVEILPEPESERYVHSSNHDSPLTGVSTSAAAVTIPAVITTTPDNVVCTEANNPSEVHASTSECKMPVLSQGNVIEEDDDDKEKAIGVSPDGR